jgi:hypothetical protein
MGIRTMGQLLGMLFEITWQISAAHVSVWFIASMYSDQNIEDWPVHFCLIIILDQTMWATWLLLLKTSLTTP